MRPPSDTNQTDRTASRHNCRSPRKNEFPNKTNGLTSSRRVFTIPMPARQEPNMQNPHHPGSFAAESTTRNIPVPSEQESEPGLLPPADKPPNRHLPPTVAALQLSATIFADPTFQETSPTSPKRNLNCHESPDNPQTIHHHSWLVADKFEKNRPSRQRSMREAVHGVESAPVHGVGTRLFIPPQPLPSASLRTGSQKRTILREGSRSAISHQQSSAQPPCVPEAGRDMQGACVVLLV